MHPDFTNNLLAVVDVSRSNMLSDLGVHPQVPHEPKEKIAFQHQPSGSPLEQLNSCQKTKWGLRGKLFAPARPLEKHPCLGSCPRKSILT